VAPPGGVYSHRTVKSTAVAGAAAETASVNTRLWPGFTVPTSQVSPDVPDRQEDEAA
jgi:hypothetical protein